MKPSALFFDKETSNRDKFGVWLKTTRTEHNLTIRELADQLSLSAAYICDIEKGNRKAPINKLEALAQIFNLPESELIYLADLAGCTHGNWKDINEYLHENQSARNAMRAAKHANLSDEEFFEIFIQTLDDAQRKDLIDETLSLVPDKDKEGCLNWILGKLSKEQVNIYNQLSNQQEKQ